MSNKHFADRSSTLLLGQQSANREPTDPIESTAFVSSHDQAEAQPAYKDQCQSWGNLQAYNCTTSSQEIYDQMIETLNPEETNFSEIQLLWIRKDWLDILFRLAFVAPIVLLGIIGNLTIIYSMLKFKPFRSKPTNIFILNMAIADLLTTIVCPNAALITHIYQFYILGSFICRFEGFVKITCLLVSSYSLIVLSSDWLLCVVKPCRTRITIRQSWLALATIWITSILMASPLFVWRSLRERQWRDLLEVWCCELIQYTKYYWVVITLFLIYLPTFFMTIVLVIILAQMDRFEAKLRQSRAGTQSNSSLSINMKYRRRIVKILFTYLLTSIICWTPLQFTIIYRHFRSEAVPSPWFFELAFFAQLSASLTAAMNPIIFGFLSQPFRHIVTKSWMFRFLDKMISANGKTSENRHENHAMHQRHNGANNHHNENGHRLDHQAQQIAKAVTAKRHHHDGSGPRSSKTAARVDSFKQPHQRRFGSSTDTNMKRVSFNTSAQNVRLNGRENIAFEGSHETNITIKVRDPPPAAIPRRLVTSTSFTMRPSSLVLMDSINIEENLARGPVENEVGAAATLTEINSDKDPDQSNIDTLP